MCSENSRCDKQHIKMANRKMDPKSTFFVPRFQNANVSQTQKHRWTSMGAKLAIRILFAMDSSRKTVKVNATAN